MSTNIIKKLANIVALLTSGSARKIGGAIVHAKYTTSRNSPRPWCSCPARELEHNQRGKYGQLSPVQLLETLKLNERRADKDELARAKFLWNRRPRLLPVISYIAWLGVAFGLPFWLFIVPAVGYPVITISAV